MLLICVNRMVWHFLHSSYNHISQDCRKSCLQIPRTRGNSDCSFRWFSSPNSEVIWTLGPALLPGRVLYPSLSKEPGVRQTGSISFSYYYYSLHCDRRGQGLLIQNSENLCKMNINFSTCKALDENIGIWSTVPYAHMKRSVVLLYQKPVFCRCFVWPLWCI